MKPGGCTTGSPGALLDQLRKQRAALIAGSNVRTQVEFMGKYRYKFYAPFINGIYTGKNVFADTLADMDKAFRMQPGTTSGSIYFEDAGDWPSFENGFIPNGWAKEEDLKTAKRLLISWSCTYSLGAVRGDTQLSSITITGGKRGLNVAPINGRPRRGQLSYSITSSGTTRVVRFWAGEKLVAEGTRVGDGAIACSAINGSGLSVAATITYSADIKANVAFIELLWPQSYEIHYSTSALSFPRTAEATVNDQGVNNYIYLTPVLAAGSYNYTVLQISDDGVTQTASIPAPSAKTLNSQPAAPTITSVTGSATAGLTVNFSNGESGCTYKGYYSKPGMPIQFDSDELPTPIGPTAVDATSLAIPNTYLSGYAPFSFSTNYSTLASAFDAAVSACNTVFTAGQTNFGTAFNALISSLKSAVYTYGEALELRMFEYYNMINKASIGMLSIIATAPAGMTTASWKSYAGGEYGRFLAFVGDLLEFSPGRYTLPNLAIGGGAPASITLGIGVNTVGRSGENVSKVNKSLKLAALPYTRNKKTIIVVRATKSGIEETHDYPYEVEFDSTGAIVAARPNQAHVLDISVTGGLTVNVDAAVLEQDAAATASHLDLYIVATGVAITPGNPSASVALGDIFNGMQRATVSYAVAAAGNYDIVVLARNNTNGTRSRDYVTYTQYVTNTAPGAVTNLTADVIRGQGVKAEN